MAKEFSWTTTEIETFWEDLVKFDARYPDENIESQEYFLGSIVLVDNGRVHLLLDGQQRLATSAIILSVIRDFLADYRQDAATRVTNRYLIDVDDATDTRTYKLTLNRYDNEFFKREILEPRDATYVSLEPTIESHNLVRLARQFIVSKFEEKYRELNAPKASFNWALRIQKVLTSHLTAVAIISDDEDNAADIFETLNDRGIGLSTPDLVRNLIMRRANRENYDEIIEIRREVLEIGNDQELRMFLRHYWISNEGDVKTRSLYREMKDKIVKRDITSLDFSRDLQRASNIYKDILSGQDTDPVISGLLTDINDLGGTILYPAIISGYICENGKKLPGFIRAMLVTYIRHNVICGLENSKLENIVYEIAKDLRKNKDFDSAVKRLIEFCPKDKEFVYSFERVVIPRLASARYLLREIEQSMRTTEELDVANTRRVHLEHIYPQNPVKRWKDHGVLLNRLGNLTLLSKRLNANATNAAFEVKVEFYRQSEIAITRDLLEYKVWTPREILRRQQELAQIGVALWSF